MVDLHDANCQPSGPNIFLFGPLALSFNRDSFIQLRKVLQEHQEHKWALDTIAALPQYWRTIVAAIPDLEVGGQLERLEDLKESISTGQCLKTEFPLPNTLLIPLVVSLQLTRYVSFIEHTSAELGNDVDVFGLNKDGQETIGFCTGMLSSLAISLAGSKEQFLKYATVAIRLGLIIGMVVDKQDAVSEFGPSKSLTTAWNSAEKGEEMRQILKDFPDVSKWSHTRIPVFLLKYVGVRVRQLRRGSYHSYNDGVQYL